jgi:hypothetical protein
MMGKKITRIRPWTKEEARMLRSLAREKTKVVIARKLKRSADAMYRLGSTLGGVLKYWEQPRSVAGERGE